MPASIRQHTDMTWKTIRRAVSGTTDFEAMALKTVIKMLLSKWGILSVDMQRAIQDDQKVYDEDGDGSYGDNQPDIVEAQDPFDKIEQKEEEQQIGGLDLEEVE